MDNQQNKPQDNQKVEKDIPSYNGEYKINENGDVFSFKRGVRHKLKPYPNWKGYLSVKLSPDVNKQKSWSVHRLVAMTFIDNPNHFEQVNHIDGNIKNNHVLNLEWCTGLMNANHRHSKLHSTDGRYGVSWKKEVGKWQTYISFKRKVTHLGYFDDKEEAYEMFYKEYFRVHNKYPWLSTNNKEEELLKKIEQLKSENENLLVDRNDAGHEIAELQITIDELKKQNEQYREGLEWLSTINPCIEYDDFKELVNEIAEQALKDNG